MWKAFFIVSLSLSTGRDDQTRTGDPYVPNVVRYQLRYIPFIQFIASPPDGSQSCDRG